MYCRFNRNGLFGKSSGGRASRVPIVALTPRIETYHHLNLVWGVRPVLFEYDHPTLEDLIHQMEATLLALNFVSVGDTILILGGVPLRKARTTSFLDIHTIGELGENPIF